MRKKVAHIKIKLKQTGILLRFFLVWSAVFFICLAPAQDLNQLRFEAFDEENGMSSPWITNLALDQSGFLWVGTYDGLNRFDGHDFKIFKHNKKDSSSLLHDNGQNIYVAKDGSIYVSYSEGGVSKFDPRCQCFRHLSLPKLNVLHDPDRIFGIKLIDKDGDFWLSGDGLGLIKYDPKIKTTENFNLPFVNYKYSTTDNRENNTVYYVHQSVNGLLWLCTQNGLYCFDKKTKQFVYKKHPDANKTIDRKDNFNKLIPDKNKGFWLSSWDGGLSYFDLQKETFTTYLFETKQYGHYNLIYDILEKNENEFWIVSGDRGLGVFNKTTSTFIFNKEIKKNNAQGILFLSQILINKNKDIFLANEDALLTFNPNSNLFHFKNLPISQSQHGNIFTIRKVMENPAKKEIYFATNVGNGLNILNTETNQLKALGVETNPNKDKKMMLINLVIDNEGKWWLLTRDYIYEFDPEKKRLIKIENPFYSLNVKNNAVEFKNFIQNSKGELWVLTADGGLYPFKVSQRKLLPSVTPTAENKLTDVSWACFDSNDNLWLIADGNLAFIKNGESKLTIITEPEISSLVKLEVKSMVSDSKGNIWLGINNKGVLQLTKSTSNKITFKLFSTDNILPTNRMLSINTDPYDNIWMVTYMGIIYFNTITSEVKLFNQNVGMDKFTIGMRLMKSNTNEFYLTSPGKYCKVNFDAVNKTIPSPTIYVDRFKVFNIEKKVPLDGSVTLLLKPGEDFFSFDFGCLDYSDQSRNNFAYMLEGWDKDWVNCGTKRYASYTNINPGKYTFKVKVSNFEGVWSKPISISLEIDTYFYKKKWFSYLAILFVAGLIFALYLYRIGQIRKTEKLNTEFNKQIAETRMEALRAQMNPHFIFNSLNSINSYIIKNDIKTSSLYLTRFAKLMRLVLENSKHQKITLSNELEALKLYIELELFRFDKKFSYEISIDQNVEIDTVEVPPLIIQPYVENAIWHGLLHKATPGILNIRLSQDKQFLFIEITDDGIGREQSAKNAIDKSSTRKSIGMKLTAERLQIQEQNSTENAPEIIDLYDETGTAAGTTVKIKIPI